MCASLAVTWSLLTGRVTQFGCVSLSGGSTRPCVLLNGLRIGATRIQADAREALAAKISELKQECDIAPVVVHDRAAYVAASITAQTAQEIDPSSDAAAEIEAVFSWLTGQLELSTTQQRDNVATV